MKIMIMKRTTKILMMEPAMPSEFLLFLSPFPFLGFPLSVGVEESLFFFSLFFGVMCDLAKGKGRETL